MLDAVRELSEGRETTRASLSSQVPQIVGAAAYFAELGRRVENRWKPDLA